MDGCSQTAAPFYLSKNATDLALTKIKPCRIMGIIGKEATSVDAKTLKAIGDPKRFQLLQLMAERGY